jgi:hypothetical protein
VAALRDDARHPEKEVLPMRLTGRAALNYAAQEGLRLNTYATDPGAVCKEITLTEANRIVEREPEAVWLEVPAGDQDRQTARRGEATMGRGAV